MEQTVSRYGAGTKPSGESWKGQELLSLLPSDSQLERIRTLSHRQTAAQLLSLLRINGTVGEAVLCESLEAVEQQLGLHSRLVLKAPWSSSGRGIRFIDGELNDYHRGWLRNLLSKQGGVMAEPYYEKVKDFGMEFESTESGIRYLGLSLSYLQWCLYGKCAGNGEC